MHKNASYIDKNEDGQNDNVEQKDQGEEKQKPQMQRSAQLTLNQYRMPQQRFIIQSQIAKAHDLQLQQQIDQLKIQNELLQQQILLQNNEIAIHNLKFHRQPQSSKSAQYYDINAIKLLNQLDYSYLNKNQIFDRKFMQGIEAFAYMYRKIPATASEEQSTGNSSQIYQRHRDILQINAKYMLQS